ncbi:MAG: acyl-ACP--UDP-N-acetylglucosamine O-acyltransferase [Chthoniobacteraceae bacterium]|jgi:UDP-N-acetylglucosamine acyltransferase
MIHPTALIHPDARISPDADIGPYVCIEGPAEISSGCVIHSHVILAGQVRIGANTRIGHGAIIGTPSQHLAHAPDHPGAVVIGESNTIRELCTIHRSITEGGATCVGSHNYLMTGAHLGHDVRLGDHVIIANNSLLGGHVQVADRVFIGGGCVFHQHMRIGRLAITQGASAFSKDIPPFTLAAERNAVAGLNVVGMRRASFDAAQRQEIKNAFKLLYKSGLNATQALAAATELDWGADATEFFDFVREAKKRGICELLESARSSPEPEE